MGYSPRGRKESDTTEQLHTTIPRVFISKNIITFLGKKITSLLSFLNNAQNFRKGLGCKHQTKVMTEEKRLEISSV